MGHPYIAVLAAGGGVPGPGLVTCFPLTLRPSAQGPPPYSLPSQTPAQVSEEVLANGMRELEAKAAYDWQEGLTRR